MIRHLRQIETDRPAAALAISGDGSLLAVAEEAQIGLFDAADGAPTGRITADAAVTGLALSADKRLMAVATGAPTVRVYGCASGKLVHKLLRDTVPDFLRERPQAQVAFMGTSKTLFTRGDNSGVTIWNCDTGAWEHLIGTPHPSVACVVSPDGRHFAMIGDPNPDQYAGQITLYRMNQGPEPRWNAFQAETGRVTAAGFSPDGSRLATCGPGGIRIWSVASGEASGRLSGSTLPSRTYIGALFCRDERHLLTLASRHFELRRLDLPDRPVLATAESPREITGFCGAVDGTTVATCGGGPGIDVWSVSVDGAGQ